MTENYLQQTRPKIGSAYCIRMQLIWVSKKQSDHMYVVSGHLGNGPSRAILGTAYSFKLMVTCCYSPVAQHVSAHWHDVTRGNK